MSDIEEKLRILTTKFRIKISTLTKNPPYLISIIFNIEFFMIRLSLLFLME